MHPHGHMEDAPCNHTGTTLSDPGCMAAVLGHSAQAALANTLFHMKVRRSELLELPWVCLASQGR
jgi:hypothetical protein